jgi:hypothetical protein
MKRHISKNTLEKHLTAVESAVRDSYPLNSSVVNNLHEIMRLALIGYETESSSSGQDIQMSSSVEPKSVPQLGIR